MINDELGVIMEEVGIVLDGKIILYDGCIGEFYNNCILVGVMYMIKLLYMVDDKLYVRNVGFYILVI